VIVGGGSGGLVAAESLRHEGFKGKIVMLSKESTYPIDRTKLTKTMEADANKLALRKEAHFTRLDIQVELNTAVARVDEAGKMVHTSDGQTFEYDHLILATGGQARSLTLL
jgi:NADPH-dependent 2,4-dienoyl-CoA reductase/sulfur reductase-like enzyme